MNVMADSYVLTIDAEDGYYVHINKPITDIAEYEELLSILSISAVPVHLLISCNGGNFDTACTLYNSIVSSKCRVTAHCIGPVDSSATLLVMAADEIVIYPLSTLTIHTVSLGNIEGTINEILDFAVSSASNTQHVFDTVYSNFLTTQELCRLNDGKKFHFNAGELYARAMGMGKNAVMRGNDGKSD